MTYRGRLFEPIFDHSPIGMIVTDAAGLVIRVNRAFTHMSGRTEESLLGQPTMSLIHPDDVQNEQDAAQALTAGERDHYRIQNRLVHQSGDTLWTRATVTRVFDGEGTDLYVSQIEDLTEARRTKSMFEHRALHDHLTGLPNRTYLLSQLATTLEKAGAQASQLACLYIDIDHLTRVNDSLGHSAGDALLSEIARRIETSTRTGDTVARLGGDEFVVIAPDIPDEEAAEALMNVVCAAVRAPITVEGHEVVTTVSGGLAMGAPGMSAESLVRNADTAMSHAKQSGRNRIAVYTDSLRESALVSLSIEAELRTAIREGQLVVHYQPIVDLKTKKPVAYEALARWNHPNRGVLLPRDFLDALEEANLMVQLGALVLHDACNFIADHPDFTGQVFVNVSSKQIGGANLTRVVRTALESSGVQPSRLGLEITESGMLLATHMEQRDIASLAELGVDLIIDDFGTGYSSLSSVLQNPVAGIKLAREFTLRLGDDSAGDRISTAIANLADSLGVYGVIEGIETQAQHERARQHGWPYAQGFLYAYPAPAHELCMKVEAEYTDQANSPSAQEPLSAASPGETSGH